MSTIAAEAASRERSSGRAALFVGAMATFAVFLDSTIVNLALPTLSREFDASRSGVEWVVDAYTLAFAAILLSAGVLSDGFGARRVFIPGVALFVLASVGCAEAHSLEALNVWRLLQGAGAAVMLPSSMSLATRHARDLHAKRVAISIWAAAGSIGMAVGPLAGGILVNGLGWRSMFWMNVAVGIVAIAFAKRLGASERRALPKLDVFGQLSATAAIGSAVFVFIEGPHQGWATWPVIAAGAIGALSVAAFVIGERRTAHPLIPPRLAAQPAFIGTALLGGIFNLAFYGVLFALSLLLQDGRGESALEAGLRFLPVMAPIFAANLVVPRIARRFGTNRVLYVGQAILAGGMLLTIFAAPMTPSWPLAVSLLPVGFGAGLIVPMLTAKMVESLPPDLTGAASGSFNTSRQVGGAIGVALYGALLGSGDYQAGFTACLAVSLACIVASAAITRALLGKRR